ncbi:sulfatase-like hydrolase/transferase [Rubellicoccus peritrichatus]|uniref:Sulfatase-like hydrolase/transferase n=1 Tax=Rubellicoccus peritrichatus TaxID=3080537 RepID=A0AAQ3LEU0_9BACT|nr:sulfatase-like hydrolase/transferase [Puniceicoccus sp. CR14]WOO43269.1 sulfatase-like hydrolase/transferase [Puniceicoccus sp. CR14]
MLKPKSGRPHIILITTDQQRGDCLGINGNNDLETPNLDHLASRGVNFNKAYITCPVCIPARRTLLSGLSPDTHGLRHYQDGVDFDPPATLPGCLRDAGYQTELIGKFHMHPQGKRFGFDNITLSETSNWRPKSPYQKRNDYVRWLQHKGVTQHPHYQGINGNGRLVAPWGMEDSLNWNNWVIEETTELLTQRRDPTCPLFLHLSFFHPHPPFIPLQHYFDRYLRKDLPDATIGEWAPLAPAQGLSADAVAGPFDVEVMRRAKAAYYALINHIDDCIAHILEQWMGIPELAQDPAYILFSSDHGEMLGDHHLFRKSLGYEASARVPFFISGINTEINSGRTNELVCWEDVAPTLLDLAGLEIPECMDGKSLANHVRGETSIKTRDHIFGQCFSAHSNLWIVTDRWKYIWFPKTNEEQLFNLQIDPNETKDLSATAHEISEMRILMAENLSTREDVSYVVESLTPCGNKPPKVFWGDRK